MFATAFPPAPIFFMLNCYINLRFSLHNYANVMKREVFLKNTKVSLSFWGYRYLVKYLHHYGLCCNSDELRPDGTYLHRVAWWTHRRGVHHKERLHSCCHRAHDPTYQIHSFWTNWWPTKMGLVRIGKGKLHTKQIEYNVNHSLLLVNFFWNFFIAFSFSYLN